MPGSPTMLTTCPRPVAPCARTSLRMASSRCRPTKRLRGRFRIPPAASVAGHPLHGVGNGTVSYASPRSSLPHLQREPPFDLASDLGRQQDVPGAAWPSSRTDSGSVSPSGSRPFRGTVRLDIDQRRPTWTAIRTAGPGDYCPAAFLLPAGIGWPGPPAPRAGAAAPGSVASQRPR